MVDRVNTQPQFLQGCGPQQRFSRILPKNAGNDHRLLAYPQGDLAQS